MGNCITTPQFPSLQKLKEFIFFNPTFPVQNPPSDLPRRSFNPPSISAGELRRKVPFSPELYELRKVQIVVSKKQLEFVLRNSNKFCSKGIAVRFSDSFEFDNRFPRWRPALATISEVHNF